MFAGLSTGAGYLAARWEHDREPRRTVVFVAADTGHRYTDAVFARHQVTDQGDLALPWSRMPWRRGTGPVGQGLAKSRSTGR